MCGGKARNAFVRHYHRVVSIALDKLLGGVLDVGVCNHPTRLRSGAADMRQPGRPGVQSHTTLAEGSRRQSAVEWKVRPHGLVALQGLPWSAKNDQDGDQGGEVNAGCRRASVVGTREANWGMAGMTVTRAIHRVAP